MKEQYPVDSPAIFEGKFINTLNGMGAMTTNLDPFSEAFVEFSGSCDFPVLEIGAAYGIATTAALSKGASVIANDLDQQHLEYLAACRT